MNYTTKRIAFYDNATGDVALSQRSFPITMLGVWCSVDRDTGLYFWVVYWSLVNENMEQAFRDRPGLGGFLCDYHVLMGRKTIPI